MTFRVIDNFLEDPDAVVASVHAAGFGTWRPNKGEVGSSVYEGMGFWGNHAQLLRALALHTGPIVPNSMFFRVTNPGMEQAYIHSDRETGAHTCVVYLSEHAEAYGTAFFRHVPTGWDRMPSMDEMRASGLMQPMADAMVSRDPAQWQQTDVVRGRYNRAVIFDAPLFHSRYPLEGLGTDAETGRLVWVTHFYLMAPSGALF